MGQLAEEAQRTRSREVNGRVYLFLSTETHPERAWEAAVTEKRTEGAAESDSFQLGCVVAL